MLQQIDIRDTWILASASVFRQFVIGLRLQGNAYTFDAHQIATGVEQHTRNSNSRIVAASYQTGEEIKLPVLPYDRRIEHAFHFVGMRPACNSIIVPIRVSLKSFIHSLRFPDRQ